MRLHQRPHSPDWKMADCKCYPQLGHADSLWTLVNNIASRLAISRNKVRVAVITQSSTKMWALKDCPNPAQIVRKRDNEDVLIFANKCKSGFQIVLIVLWNFVAVHEAEQDRLQVTAALSKVNKIRRGCERNRTNNCDCNKKECGTYTFGCSFNRFTGTCKLVHNNHEDRIRVEDDHSRCIITKFIDKYAPLIEEIVGKICPIAYMKMHDCDTLCRFPKSALFSSMSLCADMSCHLHR